MVIEISWDKECNEWIAFEFQGVIEAKGNIDGADIGTFHIKDGKPIVVIGNNEIRGDIVTLKNPLCVMKKKDSTISDDNQAEYGIVGLVHKKYLFKSRPVTIVQKTPPKERPVV